MNTKKLFSVILAIIFCFGSISIIASAEGIEEISDYEEVGISVVYRPLKSCVSFADFGPLFNGTVLKVTYPDGTDETVTVETNWTGLSDYVAGNFNVYTSYFDTMNIKTPGINKKKIVLRGMKDGIEYKGICDFTYLYIPSPAELIFMFGYALKSVLNPMFDFYI